ncbi:zinc finger protein 12-like isoform X8 [Bacillus rossius redtenbacheri]|uniref:zinc finger protein 12-like isoform X8 n=1 Tax=Bacillus rossius redtenbacheri TaxID=93214 RepID=UPI002FDC7AB7
MAEGVCVEEDPVKPEPFETVLLPVKQEIESEDGADGEWTAGAETAESRVKVKEEIDVEDFQASEQLQEAASLSVCVGSSDLSYIMEERTVDEKDSEPVCLGEKSQGLKQIYRRTHTGEKRFSCSQCSKEYKQRIHFKTHLRTHTVCVESSDLPYVMEERTKIEKDSEPVQLGEKTEGLKKTLNQNMCPSPKQMLEINPF